MSLVPAPNTHIQAAVFLKMRLSPQANRRSSFDIIISILLLLGFIFTIHVNAEGLLPNRQKHREHALIAARRHYKRQFTNETTTDSSFATDSSTSSTSSADSTSTPLQNFINNLLSDTTNATATGVLAPPVFVSATSTDPTGNNSFHLTLTLFSIQYFFDCHRYHG